MGPITLFDKSFLQSLSIDESVWFDNFFYSVICPIFYVETLAEAHYIPLAPHCTMSYLGLTASLHVAASIPFFLIHEGYKDVLPEGVARKTWEMNEKGYVALPEGPGLGVEIDEALVLKVGKEPARQFKWPDNRLKDGSIADY